MAKRQRDVAGALGSRSWVGEFEDAIGSQLVLTRHRGDISGYLQHGGAIYEIQPARGRAGEHALYRVDESRLPPMGHSPAVQPSGDLAGDSSPDTVSTDSSTAGIVIDLMVVYTPAARARFGQAELERMILNAVAESNQAYANTGIDLALNLAHLTEVAYKETGDMTKSLAALQGTSDGQMDGVHALRDQYGADLVMLISEDTNYCGYANTMRNVSSQFAAYAFSVTRSDCLSNNTFTHELGHNMGGHHNREDAGTGGAYEYSYGYRRCVSDGTGFRTVMAYPCNGGPRVNYFSDPYTSYNGQPTGIAYETSNSNSAENARTLRNTVATIAAFRTASGTTVTPTAPAAPANAAAVAVSEQRIDLAWADMSGNESGFRIERSPNGVNWSEIAQVSANVKGYVDTGLAASTWYYYRVRAWNSVGTSAYSNVASAVTPATAPPPPAPPAAPAAVAATVLGSEVTISWADMSSNESGFEVRRETYNSRKGSWGSATVMRVAVPNATSLSDSPGSGTFRYAVRSYNDGGVSAWAGPVSVTLATVKSPTKGAGKGGGNNR